MKRNILIFTDIALFVSIAAVSAFAHALAEAGVFSGL
jgi:hypothetical protein